MKRRKFINVALGTIASIPLWNLAQMALAKTKTGKRKPNVVFILADDLGWTDTSLYGSTFYETPNIDALAKRGMMFSNAYAANPLCSPTRASIMTGMYPARIGIIGAIVSDQGEKGLRKNALATQKVIESNIMPHLLHEYVTTAEVFKDAGYATAHYGKWHLGPEPYDPLHQGFDIDMPHTPAFGPVGGYTGPWDFWPGKGGKGEHIEDKMADEAINFIKDNKDKPFFLNYWAFSVHSPYNKDIDVKADKLVKYSMKAAPDDLQRNPVMAAMIETLDDNVGRITKIIDELRMAEDTIIVFFSDNGGVHWEHPAYNHGCPITNNAPLRGGKGTIYEGGVRVPLIMIYPGMVEPGSKSDEIVSSIDFHSTLIEMAGIKPQKESDVDGISIVAALKGDKLKKRPIFCHFPLYVGAKDLQLNLPCTSVRFEEWKLIRFYGDNDDQTDRFELYDLKNDISEQNNMAEKMPEKVNQLNTLIDEFLTNTDAVVPIPNSEFVKK